MDKNSKQAFILEYFSLFKATALGNFTPNSPINLITAFVKLHIKDVLINPLHFSSGCTFGNYIDLFKKIMAEKVQYHK